MIPGLLAFALALAAGASEARPRGAAEARVEQRGEDRIRRVRSSAHIEVLARDLRLTDEARQKLERIAARYHKATRKRLVVTGGTRTTQRQAQLMLEKLQHGEDIVALYENKHAATEVRDAYKSAVAHGKRKPEQLRAIRAVIEAQVARRMYVSRHLQMGAADVRSRDMTKPREAAFRAAVAEEPGVVLLDERRSAEPHLHLSLSAQAAREPSAQAGEP